MLLAGHGVAYGLLPVAPISSTYTADNGILVVEFSEPVTMVDYTKMYIRDTGQSSIDIVLADVSGQVHDTDTMTFTLDPSQMIAFDTMVMPYLAVDHAAVHGKFANPILEGYHILTILDTKPPELASATYNTSSRQMTITFDEIVTLPDYSKMHIRNSGDSTAAIALDDVTSKVHYNLNTLIITLNMSQNVTFGNLASPQLDIATGAVSDRSNNLFVATTNQTIDIDDTNAPTVESVTYNTNLGMLLITFDENVSGIDYSKMHIRDSGISTGGITTSSLFRYHHTANTVSFLLESVQKDTFHGLSAPQLDVDAGATSDHSKNSIIDQGIPITISDTIRPSFEYARYSTGDNVLSITFSENVTRGTPAVFRVHDINSDAATGISLGFDDLVDSGSNTVNATLNPSMIDKIDSMHAPRLDIDAGSIYDISSNQIRSAQDLEIAINDAIPPALIHAKYFTGNDTIHLEFSMPLHNYPNYTKIMVHDSGSPDSILFDSFPLIHANADSLIARLGAYSTLIESMTAPQLDIDAGAVSEHDDVSNTNRVAVNMTIDISDTVRPEVDSVKYATDDGTLTVMFNEPVSLLNHAKMRIHDSAASIRSINFADVALMGDDAVDAVTVTLTDLQRAAIETMVDPVFRIDHSKDFETAAAYDTSANPVKSGSYPINMSDTTPPMLVSAVYDAAVRQVIITFDESIPQKDYSKMHIHDSGTRTAVITLGDVTDKAESDYKTHFTLDLSQEWIFDNLTAPELDIEAGAVYDGSDNPIGATADNPIAIGDMTEPSVESVVYDTNLGMLLITFNEPVHTAEYANLYIRDTGRNSGDITFANLTQRHLTGDMMHVILDEESENTFNTMSMPHLNVIQNAVRDYSGNKFHTTLDIPIIINDTTRPSVGYVGYKPIHGTVQITSAVYHPGFGNMTINFAEPVTEPDLSGLYVRDHVKYVSLNMSNSVSKLDPITNQSITVWFEEPYTSEIHYLSTPLLGIKHGTVSDNATAPNHILPFLDRFTVVDITPPFLRIALISPDRNEVTLHFTEDVFDAGVTPGDFVVQYDGINATATSMTISGRSATLTLDKTLPDGPDNAFPRLFYTQTSGHIQDLSRNNFEHVAGFGYVRLIDDRHEYENPVLPQTMSAYFVPALASLQQTVEDNSNGSGGNGPNTGSSGVNSNSYRFNTDPPIMDLNSLRSSQFDIDIPYELLRIAHDHDWRTPTLPIVVNGTFDYPVTINGLGYPLGGVSNTLESQEVVADQPTSIDFVLYDYRPITHLTLYMNLHGTDIQYSNSDTYVRFDNGTLQVTDPNSLLSNVSVTQETDETYPFKTNVNLLVTFNEAMGSTNMVVRTWNSLASSMLAHLIDAITVIPAVNATTATTNSAVSVVPEPDLRTSEAEKLQTIRMWVGFDSTPTTDAELLEALGLSQDGEIPSWVKPNLGRMVVLGHITVDEFVAVVSHLIGE